MKRLIVDKLIRIIDWKIDLLLIVRKRLLGDKVHYLIESGLKVIENGKVV